MIIGIDIDGVILDTERNLNFYADYWSYFTLHKDRLRNDTTSQENCFDWTDEEIQYFFNNRFPEITRNSHIMVGAKEILKKLKEEGHKLYLITLRGYYYQSEIDSAKEKLEELGIDFDGIVWSAKDKISKCKELGIQVMIDDSAENVEQFANEDIKVLFYKEEPIRDVKMKNVTKVSSWMDIYREINKK